MILLQALNFKDLTGVSRSHVVEDFVAVLQPSMTMQKKSQEEGGFIVCIPVAHLKEAVHTLSSGVLAREKECYQL